MKIIIVSLISIIGTLAVASETTVGKTVPFNDPESTISANNKGIYLGIGYSHANINISNTAIDEIGITGHITMHAGYQLNNFLAVEGRSFVPAKFEVNKSGYYMSTSGWGVYAKPIFPMTDTFKIYGLMGYGNLKSELEGVELKNETVGVQWGAGGSFNVAKRVDIYMDYLNLANSTDNDSGNDISMYMLSLGVSYSF